MEEKNNTTPKEYSKEELKNQKDFYLTVGELKKFIEKNNLKDESIVLIQRVEDVYYQKHGWKIYLKENEQSDFLKRHNQKIESGEYLNKENYPELESKHITPATEQEIKEAMNHYHPAFSCVKYHDEQDFLFIDLHY
jgi:hypothetical protein